MGVDNRLLSLQLVEHRLTDAAMFTASGEVVQPSEVLHKRPILVPPIVAQNIRERGLLGYRQHS